MRIKILKNKPLNEEEVVAQSSVDITTTPEITFESNPLEFILQKYPSLNKTLVDLMTEDFRDYISGIYVMAPKPTIFKVVLHNNRVFYLTFMGKTYEAKVSGKKYYLAKISELEMATLSIADLLTLGTPPQAEGPTEELASTPEETDPNEPSAAETPAEEEVPEEELTESKKKFKLNLLESLINELVKIPFEDLTDEAKKVAQDLIDTISITKDQIQPASKNTLVVYDDNRDVMVDKTEASGKFGPKRGPKPQRGNFKIGNTIIIFKPLKTSGEYYELKPQQLGVTLDENIPFGLLKKELIAGIEKNDKLNPTQKKFLLGLVNDKVDLTDEEKQEIVSDNRFYGEVLKNLGEPLGAIEYGNQIGATSVFFPKAGNYPLIDYLLQTPDGEVQVSAKTAKGKGNVIKLGDLKKKIELSKGKIDPNKQKILDIIDSSDVRTGSLKLIPEFGDDNLKKQYEEFLSNNPKFPAIGSYNPSDRLALEREIIKQLNNKFNFSDEFNKFVAVHYVKYFIDLKTLQPSIKVIKDEGFKVKLKSKNSPGHDTDKIGFEI